MIPGGGLKATSDRPAPTGGFHRNRFGTRVSEGFPSRGFTVIELIVVIIILAVLAAVALPRFVDMSSNARIAAVKAASGAVSSAATLAGMACYMSQGCVANGPGAYVTGADGSWAKMWYGYPTGQTRTGDAYHGIKEYVALPDFTTIEDPSYTDFTKSDAPDPSNCKVRYNLGGLPPAAPTVVLTTSGC